MKLVYAIFSSLVLASFGTVSAFAMIADTSCRSCVEIPDDKTLELYKEILPLVIWTDESIYDHNSNIVVNGHTNNVDLIHPVIISIISPVGNLVGVSQVMVDSNGEFSASFNTGGKLWNKNGDYIIKAIHISESRMYKTQITIIDQVGEQRICGYNQVTINADNGGVYCVDHSILAGATGIDGTLDTQSMTLTINVRGTDIDFITLDIPRWLLDSQSGSSDNDFVVLVNGKEAVFKENPKFDDKRSLTVMFPPDRDTTIEIMGTSVVPEFGAIAALILGIAVLSIIVVSAKTKLSLIPRY